MKERIKKRGLRLQRDYSYSMSVRVSGVMMHINTRAIQDSILLHPPLKSQSAVALLRDHVSHLCQKASEGISRVNHEDQNKLLCRNIQNILAGKGGLLCNGNISHYEDDPGFQETPMLSGKRRKRRRRSGGSREGVTTTYCNNCQIQAMFSTL